MHEIRLREPWKLERNDDDLSAPAEHWFSRSFHSPSGVTADERIDLSITPSSPTVETEILKVELNTKPLNVQIADAEWRIELSSCLAPFNSLRLNLRLEDAPPTPKLSELLDIKLQIIEP